METELKKTTSTGTALSWSMYIFFYQFLTGVFDVFLIYFYQINLGLDIIWITAAIWIFTIWDAINDPLIGFITDKLFKFTPKLGKRFPWIILGSIISILSFILLYSPPILDGNAHPVELFVWMTIMTCLYDTGLSMCELNSDGLFPDKFRNAGDRRKVQGWTTPIALLALPISTLLPEMLLFNQDDPSSYLTFALLSSAIMLGGLILGIHGIREDKVTIGRYYTAKPEKREKFIESIKTSFKQKSWVVLMIVSFGYLYLISAIQGTVAYYVDFVIDTDNSMAFMIMMSTMIVGAMIASPVWVMIYRKLQDNKKAYIIAGIVFILSAILFSFMSSLLGAIFSMLVYGFGMGAFWVLNSMIKADVYDERSAITGTDQRGSAVGVFRFFGKFSRLINISIFALIQYLTGFNAASDTQTDLAVLGIRLQTGIIPAVLFGIFLIVLWKTYPLDKKRVAEVHVELNKLGI